MKTTLITTVAVFLFFGCAHPKPKAEIGLDSKTPIDISIKIPVEPVPKQSEPIKEEATTWRDDFKKLVGVQSARDHGAESYSALFVYSFTANRFDSGQTNYFLTVECRESHLRLWKELYTDDGQRMPLKIESLDAGHPIVSTSISRDLVQRFASGTNMVRLYSPETYVTLRIQPAIAGAFIAKCDGAFGRAED